MKQEQEQALEPKLRLPAMDQVLPFIVDLKGAIKEISYYQQVVLFGNTGIIRWQVANLAWGN